MGITKIEKREYFITITCHVFYYRAMKKVFAMSLIISLIFHISESAFEFRSNDGNFIVHLDTSKFSLYGFGGSAFCMSSSACFAVCMILPLIYYHYYYFLWNIFQTLSFLLGYIWICVGDASHSIC